MTTTTAFRTRKPAFRTFFGFFTLAVCLILLNAGCKPKLHLAGGQVHGFVVAEFANVAGALPTQIALPDVSVYLKNTVNGKHSAKVKTNALGHFATNHEKAGTYQVCVEADGFAATCDPKVVTITASTVVLNHNVVIAPEGSVVQGRILFKDGNPCYQDNQHFGTYVTTKVSLHDSGGKLLNQPRTVNNNGYYVLPKVPGAGSYQIEADCDGFKGSQSLTLTGLQLSGGTPINVGLANSGPRVTSVVASLSGTMVQQATPGTALTVRVRAYDPDGDQLHYKWSDGSGSFPTQDSSTIQWTLPTTQQLNFLWVEVSDGKGGYARQHVSISTAPWSPVFGGTVVERATGRPVGGALVTINGTRIASAANGAFQYTGRKDEFNAAVSRLEQAPRYVLNVRKPGYALLSRVVYSSTPQMKLMLDRAARTTCNPNSPCAASEQGQLATTHVQIDANSIVDQNGNPASATVNVDVHGYDMTVPDPIPGDNAALDKNGKSVTMMTLGAINVDLSDASGNTYNLAPGKTARISIPVNTSLLSGGTPPATIPLWSFNEQTGVWQQEATATYDSGAQAYVGNVPHFSAWNADAVFSNTACVFIGVDSSTGPEVPFQLRAAPSTPPGYVRHTFTADSSDLPGFAFYRLIPNSVVTVEVHPNSGPDYVMGTFTINAGPTIDTTTTNYDAAPYFGIPPDPQTECNGYDNLKGPGVQPDISLTIPVGQTYLSLLGPNPAPSLTVTQSYYQTVGALDSSNNPITTPGGRGNFTAWKQTNGLGQGPGGTNSPNEVEAIYFNNGDLQLGRDMHCLQTGSNVACYVTNYGTLQGPSQPAIVSAETKTGAVASVAMEYNSTLGSNAVRFYAFKADNSLFDNPILDSQGSKFLPQNCMACHGGTYNTTTNNVDNASFLPFDIYSFLYDSTANPTYGTTPPGGVPLFGSVTVNQEQTFRQLNALVLATNPNSVDPNQPVINLINGWYSGCGGVNTPGCTVTDTYAPPPPTPGWVGAPANLYQTIPRVYCRTCHGSQGSATSGYPDWTQYSSTSGDGFDNPGFIGFNACPPTNPTPVMPHAEVPFKRFWLSANPSAPAYLADPTLGINITAGCTR
ncbi:MAG: carboxypeptidase-like regulatory domain-containing protein [Terriglobales bacterium]